MTAAQQTALDENGWRKCSEFRSLDKDQAWKTRT